MKLSKKILSILIFVIILIIVNIIAFVLDINKGQAPINPFESIEPVVENGANQPANPDTSASANPNVGEVSVQGQIVCLPRKDTESPAILLCTFGLKGDNGNYYALEPDKLEDGLSSAGSNKVLVEGYFSPVEMLSSNIGQIYDIIGVIRVSSIEILNEK